MRLLDFSPELAREVTHYGSRGLTARALVRHADVAVTILRVSAGGEIGRHPTTVDQLFLVVAGRGEVSGDDGARYDIAVGHAALWSAGEHHATRAHEDLVAVVVEMDQLTTTVTSA